MLGAFLAIALIGALILFALVTQTPRSRRSNRGPRSSARQPTKTLSRDQIHDRWQTIQTMSATGGNGLRQAINEADKLFDHVMRQQGASGDSMGDRLQSFRTRFSDYVVYDNLWKAHKLRNTLAHEVGFDLVAVQAKDALAGFERGLKDLGAL